MLIADLVDRIGSAVRVKFQSITWSLSEVAKEPDERAVVNFARTDACFCKLADCKEYIGAGIVGKVEKCAYH